MVEGENVKKYTKTKTYDNGPKMKRDAWVKVVFLLRKNTTFTQAFLFIFGPLSYVTVLVSFEVLS